ncbi:hypothetical protein SKAU_G00131700 [Synaphobranchus kaupii]|uniref:PiggyBac transposable element-derived protein domain-containing protein n=1 Tax=Synaphobranchus kaupii TaxID=118154 RepID=A0A9Q1J2E6_SYNKA|nr:hypothetical protein SKAU_G00131700 [Synaphobranchus kaupii]
MSRNRFREVMRFLHFDRKESRRCRLTTDKFALMAEVWVRFVQNGIACYKPGSDTVDEQLFPTKARIRFTQYMPNKPNKFGIKFWLAADVQTKYMIAHFNGLHGTAWHRLQQERWCCQFSRSRLRRAILFLSQVDDPPAGHYAQVNATVPVLQLYFNGDEDLMMSKTTVWRLVHIGVNQIAALRQEVISLPTAGELQEVGQGFAQVANSPVFSKCVGAIDGCHVRIKTPPGPSSRD